MNRMLLFVLIVLSFNSGLLAQNTILGMSVIGATGEVSQTNTARSTATNEVDDPVARKNLKNMLSSYIPTSGADWNVTLHLNVSMPKSGQESHTVKLVGSTNVERAFTRSGKTIVSTFAPGGGTVVRDGNEETIPIWTVQSMKVPEFPFPEIAARLADPNVLVNLVPDENPQDGLIHFTLTKLCLDLKGHRVPTAEKVFKTDLFFDPGSGLLLKERHWIFSPSSMVNNAQIEVDYDSYQIVAGMQVPFHVVKRLGGITLSDSTIQSVDLNANNSKPSF